MKKIAFACLAFLTFFTACERKKTDSSEASSKKVEKVQVETKVLNDSLDLAWNRMKTSDDQKYKDIKRLLLEVSYTPGYNIVLHDSLDKYADQVYAQRYDRNSISDLKKVDHYDSLSTILVERVMYLVGKTKDIDKHPLATELTQIIATEDQMVALYKGKYDRWAKEYNQYLDQNKKSLEKLGEPYTSMKPAATFAQ